MPRKNLTTRFVESVKVEARTDFWDELVRGLVLRTSPTGVKTWTVVYSRESDGARQRLTLGRFPAVPLEKARSKALTALASVGEGDDPANKKRVRRDTMTVKKLGELYIEKYAKLEKRTWGEDERVLGKDVYPTIGDMKIVSVRRRDVLDVIDAKAEAGKVGQSRKVLAVVRKMFNWAVAEDYLEVSPVAGVKPKGRNGQRDRYLTDAEIKTVWQALESANLHHASKDIMRLLFLTGQRSGEVCGMLRSEVDFDKRLWTIPGERTKNGRTHAVHLSDAAFEIVQAADDKADEDDKHAPLFRRIDTSIESTAVAHSVKKQLQVLETPWTPHDARRTVATGMAAIGIAPHIIEAVLNHVSGFRSGVAGVYNRNAYEPEKRSALDRWADHLDAVIKGKKVSNVVELRA